MISLFVFIFGLAVGSFLNAFIYRLEVHDGLTSSKNGKRDLLSALVKGRSQCPLCAHTLAWQDLIPVLSFILLQGKCRHCRAKISFQYPLVELAIGFLFVGIFYSIMPWFGQGMESLAEPSFLKAVELLYLWTIASFLTVIFVYDLKHFLIPDKILYPAIGLVLFWQVFLNFEIGENLTKLSFFQMLFAGLGVAAFFFSIYLFSKGKAMGFGDVKLALFMGFFLSWPNILVALAVAFGTGAIVGLALICLKRKTMRSEVPFGPFLVLGTLVAFLWGGQAGNFYMNFMI